MPEIARGRTFKDMAKTLDGIAGRLTNRVIRATPRDTILVPTREPIVTFSFDDVPDSALFEGAAILERHGVRGTFYIAGGLEGRVEPDRTLIDAAGCRELAARGHEIGCHTYAHAALRTMTAKNLAADLSRNAQHLDNLVPGPPGSGNGRRNFAFPYNAGSFKARRRLAETFRSCRAGGEAINRGRTDPSFLSGVEIRQPESDAESLTGWIDALVAAPGWLIFFTHDITAMPTPYGCTPRTFDRLVAHTISSGCTVLTVSAALDHFGLREAAR